MNFLKQRIMQTIVDRANAWLEARGLPRTSYVAFQDGTTVTGHQAIVRAIVNNHILAEGSRLREVVISDCSNDLRVVDNRVYLAGKTPKTIEHH